MILNDIDGRRGIRAGKKEHLYGATLAVATAIAVKVVQKAKLQAMSIQEVLGTGYRYRHNGSETALRAS